MVSSVRNLHKVSGRDKCHDCTGKSERRRNCRHEAQTEAYLDVLGRVAWTLRFFDLFPEFRTIEDQRHGSR